jgi:hypothetical protein
MYQMRNITTALHSYATANHGDLPMLRGIEIENDTDPDNAPYTTGWMTALLPYIDHQGLYDRLLALDAAANAPGAPDSFEALTAIQLRGFVCPDAPQAERPGALSYVANMGYMTADLWDNREQALRHQVSGTYNWNNGDFGADSPEDASVSRATGVITYDTAGQPNSLARIPDGTTQTILLAENLNAGPWISGHPHDIGFAVRIGGTADHIPLAAESPEGLGGGTQESALQFHTVDGNPTINLGPSAINAPVGNANNSAPRPSSTHPGCVNLFFCDGHGKAISEKIDPTVYARLVTSGGQQYGQEAIPDSDF